MKDTEDSTADVASDSATFMQKMRMLSGYQIGRALRFAVHLDLATILVDGPCTLDDLAAFTDTDRGLLERHVRRLESVGVFRLRGSVVEITELGASLAREGGGGLSSADVSALAAEAEPAAQPCHTGQLTTVQQVRHAAESGALDDALVVSSVLNDWTDDEFGRILAGLAAATEPGGRLVLIELVLPPDGVVRPVGDTDPLLVSALGGRGHTAAEWEAVLDESGFRLDRIRPGTPPFSFIEATRR